MIEYQFGNMIVELEFSPEYAGKADADDHFAVGFEGNSSAYVRIEGVADIRFKLKRSLNGRQKANP